MIVVWVVFVVVVAVRSSGKSVQVVRKRASRQYSTDKAGIAKTT